MSIATENDLVLLVGKDRKQFFVRLTPGAQLQTHHGCIAHDDLISQPLGREVHSHLGAPFLVLEPSTHDLIKALKRTTQIMYPKDIGYVLLKMNVKSGRRVIEAGTGSGGLCLALAQAVMPTGRVYSYEVASSTEWAFGQYSPAFEPQVFVDITDTLSSKIQAMEAYESEARPFPHPRSPESLRAMAMPWGSQVGVHAAEAVCVVRDLQ